MPAYMSGSAGGLVGYTDLIVDFYGFRDAEEGGEIDRAGMDAGMNAGRGRVRLAHIGVDVTDPVPGDIHHANADRCADPLVEIDSYKVSLEVGEFEIVSRTWVVSNSFTFGWAVSAAS